MDFQWPDTHAFSCDREGMAAALAWIEERMAAIACGEASLRRAQLLVDELYANTLLHGGEAARRGRVELALAQEQDELLIFYADAGPAFDTAAAAAASELPEDDRIGGAGLVLLRKLSRVIRYARVEGQNRIVLVLPLGEGPVG